MIRYPTGLPLKPRKPRRSGPRRRSLFRSRIRNAWRSDTDASRRTRLAGLDPGFGVLVCHPSSAPPFPEKLGLRSHRLTPHRPSGGDPRGTQFEWGWAPNRSGFGSPTLASVVGQLAAARLLMTSTSGLETRKVPGSIFRGPCSDPAPFPLAGGTRFVLRRVLGHRLGRGPAAARMSRPSGTSKRVRACCQRWSGQVTKKDPALSLPCWVTALVRDRIVVGSGLSWSRTRSWPQRWSMFYRGDGSWRSGSTD